MRYQRLVGKSSVHESCPLRGFCAADFAAGEHLKVFETLSQVTVAGVCQQGTDILSDSDLSMVLDDLQGGITYIKLELVEKLRFWHTLPWLIAGLLHRSVHMASEVAQKIIMQLSASEDPSSLPRQAQKWLAPEYMEELKALANRTKPRQDLRTLVKEAAKYLFLPTSERRIEQPHAVVTKAVCGRRKKFPVTISLANRMPEVERRIR